MRKGDNIWYRVNGGLWIILSITIISVGILVVIWNDSAINISDKFSWLGGISFFILMPIVVVLLADICVYLNGWVDNDYFVKGNIKEIGDRLSNYQNNNVEVLGVGEAILKGDICKVKLRYIERGLTNYKNGDLRMDGLEYIRKCGLDAICTNATEPEIIRWLEDEVLVAHGTNLFKVVKV